MTSDTPRTDEAATRIGDGVWVSAEVARDLERELADLKARIEAKAEKYQSLHDDRPPTTVTVLTGTALSQAQEFRSLLEGADQ